MQPAISVRVSGVFFKKNFSPIKSSSYYVKIDCLKWFSRQHRKLCSFKTKLHSINCFAFAPARWKEKVKLLAYIKEDWKRRSTFSKSVMVSSVGVSMFRFRFSLLNL